METSLSVLQNANGEPRFNEFGMQTCSRVYETRDTSWHTVPYILQCYWLETAFRVLLPTALSIGIADFRVHWIRFQIQRSLNSVSDSAVTEFSFRFRGHWIQFQISRSLNSVSDSAVTEFSFRFRGHWIQFQIPRSLNSVSDSAVTEFSFR